MANSHKENAAKGGRIGGPKSPTNFKNNPSLASEAGKKSKRGPAKANCDWCSEVVIKKELEQHQKTEHPKLYAKFIEPNKPAK